MKKLFKALTATAGLTIPLICNAMLDWNARTVSMVSSTYDRADCIVCFR